MGMFAFSPLIWQYATTAEVFPMNTFFTALILYLVLLYSKKGNKKVIFIGSFVCGLALCNQHTIILYEIPLVLWMLVLFMDELMQNNGRYMVYISLCFFLGLSPYLYLYLSAIHLPNNKSGSWGNTSNLSGFMHHLLRRDYGTFRLFSGKTGENNESFSIRNIAYWMDNVQVQGYYIVPFLAIYGISRWIFTSIFNYRGITAGKRHQSNADTIPLGCKQHNRLHAWTPFIFLVTQLFYFGVFHSLSNLPLSDKLLYGVHQRFWMQPNVLLFTWSGIGFLDISRITSLLYCGSIKRLQVNHSTAKTTTTTTNNSTSMNKNVKSVNQKVVHHRKKTKNNQGSLFVLIEKMWNSLTIAGTQEYPNYFTSQNFSSVYEYMLPSTLLFISLSVVFLQYWRWIQTMNQSDALYFDQYAKSILDSLPENALLLVNYDMQWSSLRYITQCEMYRSDIVLINLSMMTYTWFDTKRVLFPSIQFPGNYLASRSTLDVTKSLKPFTMSQFLHANKDKHEIFIGGKLSVEDPIFNKKYDLIPHGIVNHVVSKEKSVEFVDTMQYFDDIHTVWQRIAQRLLPLPSLHKYGQETWEWTIGRNLKDQLIASGAYSLELALQLQDASVHPIVYSLYLLESVIHLELSHSDNSSGKKIMDQTILSATANIKENSNYQYIPTSFFKNIGLAHMNLVRAKKSNDLTSLSLFNDFFGSFNTIRWPSKEIRDWKGWSAKQFLHYWKIFLERDDASDDPQYGTIKSIYSQVKKNDNR
jgi:hypothetical protein